MTKYHSDGTKAWKGLLGVMCMDYEMQKKNKKEGDRGEQYKRGYLDQGNSSKVSLPRANTCKVKICLRQLFLKPSCTKLNLPSYHT